MIRESKFNNDNLFFEGPQLEKEISDFNYKKRIINQIDMNKVILSSLFGQLREVHTDDKKISLKNILFTSFYFFKMCISVMIYRMRLKIDFFGKNKIWVLKQSGELRPSYKKEYKGYINSSNPPYLICWEKKKTINFSSLKRFFQYLSYIKLCSSSVYELKHAISNARLVIFSIDLYNDKLWNKLPKGVLSLKDFQGFDNAIIQIANIKSIPTFTTQHSVPHFFKGKNFREANIMLINCVANNILCWGKYIHNLFKKYYPNKNMIKSSANLRPTLLPSNSKVIKDTYVFVLGGRRHTDENQKLIKIANKLDKKEDNCIIYFRLHPTSSVESYSNTISNLKFKNHIIIQESKNLDHKFDYPSHSIVVTGMSGSYYDYLYLGYKVVDYTNNFEMLEKLPRVLPNTKSSDNLFDQISNIKSFDNESWELRANKILEETINLSIRQKREKTLVDEIDLILKNKLYY